MAVKKIFGSKSSTPEKSSTTSNSPDLNRMIQERAYYIWESKGKPAGKDIEIWAQAEKDIRAKLRK